MRAGLHRPAAALALGALLAGCGGGVVILRPGQPIPGEPGPATPPGQPQATRPGAPEEPPGTPGGLPAAREGWTTYLVGGGLRVEAPSAWSATGDASRLKLDAEGAARLEAWRVDDRFGGPKACLEAAEASLERAEAQLSRVRRHGTTLAGRPAVVQEADAGGWHGWAYAVCHGGAQYRLVFTGRSPIAPALLEAWREVVKAVRLGGGA